MENSQEEGRNILDEEETEKNKDIKETIKQYVHVNKNKNTNLLYQDIQKRIQRIGEVEEKETDEDGRLEEIKKVAGKENIWKKRGSSRTSGKRKS